MVKLNISHRSTSPTNLCVVLTDLTHYYIGVVVLVAARTRIFHVFFAYS